MNSVEYIKKAVDELVERFAHIRCRYTYAEDILTHYVEIHPQFVYDSDMSLKDEEYNITMQFIGLFPSECLVFVSEEDQVECTEFRYEKSGFLYSLYKDTEEYNWASLEIFKFFSPDVFTSFPVDFPKETPGSSYSYHIHINNNVKKQAAGRSRDITRDDVRNAGENDYALAA